MEYVIITSKTEDEDGGHLGDETALEKHVNEMICQGWKVQGGAFYVPTDVSVGYFSQAMTRDW